MNYSNSGKKTNENEYFKIQKLNQTGFYYSTKYGGLLGGVQEITLSKDSIGLINGTDNFK